MLSESNFALFRSINTTAQQAFHDSRLPRLEFDVHHLSKKGTN
jgi:hypothetical protein